MFNPFYPFTQKLLDAFVAKGKTYFVRQTFARGRNPFDSQEKGSFLFTHYDNLVTAQDHYGAISHDRNRFLYDWNNTEHQDKLRIAASNVFKEYRNYASVFRTDYEKGLTDNLKKQIRSYVSNSLGWQIKGGDSLDTNFELQFGELFMRLKHGSRQAKVKFEDIENQH